MNEKKFYTCKWDIPFKEVFLNEKNRDLLKCLLETILKVEIYNIKELNVERRSNNIYIKQKRVDLLIDTNIGRIGIELNSVYKDYLHARNMAYHADNYRSYILKGEEYEENTKIIQINFTYGLESNKKTNELDLKILEIYEMQNEEGLRYVDNFLLYEFNMDKIMKLWYSKDKEKIEEYKYLIMLDLKPEELKVLSKSDEMVERYMENIERINEDPEFYVYMTREEDQRKCHTTEINSVKRASARELLKLGKNSLEEISIISNLPIEKIKKLEEYKEYENNCTLITREEDQKKYHNTEINLVKIAVAKELIKMGILSIEQISEATKLDVTEIQKLVNDIK